MDALGQEISVGSIIVMSGTRQSGFQTGVVEKMGRSRINLRQSYASRKDKENVIVITEEQFMGYVRAKWLPKANEDGNFVIRQFTGEYRLDEHGRNRPIYQEVATPIEEKIQEEVRKTIITSRILREVPLEEYEPTQEEVEKLKL